VLLNAKLYSILLQQVPVQEARGSPFVSLFNVLGIIAAGVLGALYTTSKKEKAAMESTIKSVNNLKTWNTYSLSWCLRHPMMLIIYHSFYSQYKHMTQSTLTSISVFYKLKKCHPAPFVLIVCEINFKT